MNIAEMCRQDTGGQAFKIARAVTAHTPHTSRNFRTSPDYLEFPGDIWLRKHDVAYVRQFLRTADIIHCHRCYKSPEGWQQRGYRLNPKARWLIHQHGRPGNMWKPWLKIDRKRGAFRVVSTLNLLRYVGGDFERWVPAAVRLSEFDDLKARYWKGIRRRGGKILVAHSPTRRDYKGTDHYLRAIAQLQSEGLNVHPLLIWQVSNKECLRLKSQADITYDQMHLCYGNSGLEAMAFGQPTIVGPTGSARGWIKEHIGYEPYVHATPDTLTDRLRELVCDADLRQHWGAKARKYMETWHAEKVVAERVVKMYEKI